MHNHIPTIMSVWLATTMLCVAADYQVYRKSSAILCLKLSFRCSYLFLCKVATLLQEVKEYIRRAKIWRNGEWKKDEIGRPSSYLMSLLVVRAFEIASSNRKVDGRRYACYWICRKVFFSQPQQSVVFLFSSKQLFIPISL